MNIAPKSLPKLNESELEFAYKSISKALISQALTEESPDFSESLNILKKYYNKGNPLLDINETLPMFGGWTPLAVASYFNTYRAVTYLLQNGANPNIASDNCSYPLHLAAGKGHETSVLYLLKGGAQINRVDAIGKTALMRACERPLLKPTLVELFFNKTITKEELDLNLLCENKSCLDIAKQTGSPDIAKLLSYLSLKTKLIEKGVHEKRVKI